MIWTISARSSRVRHFVDNTEVFSGSVTEMRLEDVLPGTHFLDVRGDERTAISNQWLKFDGGHVFGHPCATLRAIVR